MYLFGRGLPALITVGAVAIYTRLLDPVSVGAYALLLSASLLGSSIGFSWLRGGAFRVAAGLGKELQPNFAATVGVLFFGTSIVTAAIVCTVLHLYRPSLHLLTLILVAFAVIMSAWNELNGSMLQARLSVVAWGLLSFSRAACALVFSLLLIRAGLKTDALLGGFVLGNCATLMWLGLWRPGIGGAFDSSLFRKLFLFGWPSSINAALAQLSPTFQRYVLAAAAGTSAVGLYAVSQDFASQTILVLVGSVSLAGIPRAIKAKDQAGPSALAEQLRANASLIFAIAFPAAIALVVLAGPLSAVVFGAKFRTGADVTMALIALATLGAGLRTYYFDQAFELAFETRPQAVISVTGTAIALLASLTLIPRFGAVGAGCASLTTSTICLLMSAVWGRRVLHMPLPLRSWSKTLLATAGMVAVLELVPKGGGILGLVVAAAAGAVAYVAFSTVTRPQLVRTRLVHAPAWLQR
jgi:O-antigen/teichoic acid export membrane protein